MKECPSCTCRNPQHAVYCLQCGRPLPEDKWQAPPDDDSGHGGFSLFTLTLLGSLAVSLVLIVVFDLPVLLLAGFLPLFWTARKK